MTDMLSTAIEFATRKMAGQLDATGSPAIFHPLRVMMHGTDEDSRVAGVLHDLIEDTDTTEQDLLIAGFPRRIVDAVVTVSRRSDETYREFIIRIARSNSLLAIGLKLNDLADNLSRVDSHPNATTLSERYVMAGQILSAHAFNVEVAEQVAARKKNDC